MFIKVPGTTDKEAVYYSKTVTWGTQAESNCAWQCSCHSSQYGCGSMDKCARYTFDGATHLCQVRQAERPLPSAPPKCGPRSFPRV